MKGGGGGAERSWKNGKDHRVCVWCGGGCESEAAAGKSGSRHISTMVPLRRAEP